MARSSRNPHISARDGVSPSCVALPGLKAGDQRWPGVIDFLDQRLPTVGRKVWAERLATGAVLDETGQAVPPDAPYRGNTRLYYYRALPDEKVVPFEATVIYQDAHLVVADKPHFLPVTPGGRYVQQTLLVRLQRQLGLPRLAPLHRIDRETAGLVLFSTRPESRDAYQRLFRERRIAKVYEALAPALPGRSFPLQHRSRLQKGEPFHCMREEEGDPNSETLIDVLDRQGPVWRYRLVPESGRKHQLRVHMAALGAPILGDGFYPQLQDPPQGAAEPPLQLLAQVLAFDDPLTGQRRSFRSTRTLCVPG